jgi:glycosyltransferase involved in cell wall biosynthesis
MKVALDASFAAEIALRDGENVVGISRAVSETVRALGRQDGIEVTCVGWCGADPVLADVRVRHWASDRGLPTDSTELSRLGLDRIYRHVARGFEQDGAVHALSRLALAALKRTDVRPRREITPYDVLHSTFLPLPERSRAAAVARVLTVYDLIPLRDRQATGEAQRGVLRAILASIDLERDVIVAISEHTRAEVCDHLELDPARVVVAPLAAAGHFHPRAFDPSAAWLPASVQAGAPYLLSVASVQPRKNVGLLVEAFAALRRREPEANVQLVLTGTDGWLGDGPETLLRSEAGLASHVHRIGFVPDGVLAQLYAGAHAFVFPSRSEGFGLPALEAMQSGTATVVARAGALPEVVGDAALIVEPDDKDGLLHALERVINDDALRLSLGAAGIARSRAFSWDRCATATSDAYRLAVEWSR